jgi:hypothetical protein
MTINQKEVDQMASFMRALSATEADASPILRNEAVQPNVVGTPSATHEMKLILERFHAAADNTAVKVTEQAIYDPELREALTMEQTPRGSRIGVWEIEMREEGKRRFYSVEQSGITIATDLLLYEAAHGLVRILNGGGRMNSPQAINLLRLEQDYTSALNDAVLYKHYLVKNPRDDRIRVFEARYSAAKHRAIMARDRIAAISDRY